MDEKTIPEKSDPTTKEGKANTATKSRRYVNEGMKLAVALHLKMEGYETVVFNRVVKVGARSVVIDVLAEDSLGYITAVYCINRTDEAEEKHLNDIACLVLDGLGEECSIAFAYPLRLVRLVRNAIGLANRIYMVDDEGRVWCHYPSAPNGSIGSTWKPMEELGEERTARLKSSNLSIDIRRCDFYVV